MIRISSLFCSLLLNKPPLRRFTAMSWMDSWSRPNKSSAVPPPYYITQGENVLYCHTCGRVMTPRKSHNKPGTIVKYCSDRCRTRKPNALDHKIEDTIRSLLAGEEGSGIEKTSAKSKLKKGDKRILVTCDEIELVFFGHEQDPLKTFGRRKNRYSRAIGGPNEEFKSVDMISEDGSSEESDQESIKIDAAQRHADMVRISNGKTGAKVRPPQTEAEMNFAAMGGERSKSEKILESEEDLQKRIEGQRRAEERELVRKAARRAVVFGLIVDEEQVNQSPKRSKMKNKPPEAETTVPVRRKCEAVMQGQVVEPSYAKGNWAIRWRE